MHFPTSGRYSAKY
uniref:Uncharacterized protein n=1 Tax=Anguilla anguilla TaxID=7936 RepID=A0A0E9UBN3_ANGAN